MIRILRALFTEMMQKKLLTWDSYHLTWDFAISILFIPYIDGYFYLAAMFEF